jgi:hypothetical protein
MMAGGGFTVLIPPAKESQTNKGLEVVNRFTVISWEAQP